MKKKKENKGAMRRLDLKCELSLCLCCMEVLVYNLLEICGGMSTRLVNMTSLLPW